MKRTSIKFVVFNVQFQLRNFFRNLLILLNLTKNLSKKNPYIQNIQDSHDVVCYLMTLMNYRCATNLTKFEKGIFRISPKNQTQNITDVPKEIGNFIQIWKSECAEYISIDNKECQNNTDSLKHNMLNLEAYIHITSPIRRLVDILNMIQFQLQNKITILSQDAVNFYDEWSEQLVFINTSMKNIRKIQRDCTLLDIFYSQKAHKQLYDGYVIDSKNKTNELYKYDIYFPELKVVSNITTTNILELYDKQKYYVYLFKDENNLTKKCRFQLAD